MYLEVDQSVMVSKTRVTKYAEARHWARYFMRKYTKLSLEAIGVYFGKVNHSTIISSLDIISDYLSPNCAFYKKEKFINEELEAIFSKEFKPIIIG